MESDGQRDGRIQKTVNNSETQIVRKRQSKSPELIRGKCEESGNGETAVKGRQTIN